MKDRTANNSALPSWKMFWVPVVMTGLVLSSCGDVKAEPSNKQLSEATHVALTKKATPAESPEPSRASANKPDKLAEAKSKFVINAPREVVWQVLTNFQEYPHIFRRLESCRITKQEGDLVWTESDLKPHMLVRTPRQHTIMDLSHKPNVLDWRVVDGNFKTVIGKWELQPAGRGDRCAVVYTLAVDPGPILPKFLVSFALRNFQKEISNALKEWVETSKMTSQTNLHAEGRGRSI